MLCGVNKLRGMGWVIFFVVVFFVRYHAPQKKIRFSQKKFKFLKVSAEERFGGQANSKNLPPDHKKITQNKLRPPKKNKNKHSKL